MFRVEPLFAAHDRVGFDCGVEPLNRYFRQVARQHGDKSVSKTYVLVDESVAAPKPVAGYFTLTFCTVESAALPPAWAKRLPDRVPAMRLGRLAVSRLRQRQRIGSLLLSVALRLVERATDIAGGIGLFVDAKDKAAAAYYAQFGFIPLEEDPLTLFLPMSTIRQHNAAIVDKTASSRKSQ